MKLSKVFGTVWNGLIYGGWFGGMMSYIIALLLLMKQQGLYSWQFIIVALVFSIYMIEIPKILIKHFKNNKPPHRKHT